MSSKWRQLAVLGIVIVAILGASAVYYFGNFTADRRQLDPQRVARGQQVYSAYCAACHGANLEGQDNWRQRGADGLLPAPPHDAAGHTWHHPDQQLFQIIKFGTAALVGGTYKSAMNGFGDQLSDADIDAVIDFLKSRWPAEIRQRQGDVTTRAGQAQ
jgi:mono/diheme cytochrome c family protein